MAEAQAVAGNARVANNDLGTLRAEVDASLRKVEQLVNEINRKWPFKRDTEDQPTMNPRAVGLPGRQYRRGSCRVCPRAQEWPAPAAPTFWRAWSCALRHARGQSGV